MCDKSKSICLLRLENSAAHITTLPQSACLAVELGHKVVVALDGNVAEASAGVAAPLPHVAAGDGGVEAAIKGDDGYVEGRALFVPATGIIRPRVENAVL